MVHREVNRNDGKRRTPASRTKRSALLALLLTLGFAAASCGTEAEADVSTDRADQTENQTGNTASTDDADKSDDNIGAGYGAGESMDASADADGYGDSEMDEGMAAGAGLSLAASPLGDVLVDADGNTIYLFVPDAQGASTCYDQCEANWPVVGALDGVGAGLDEALLGTIGRDDGTVQATYNGWPLYYFAADNAAGDINGQGVGDVWFVINAAGTAVS